ncbi:hypothetical protein GLOIN_2v1678543 [Rhizophagus clarus]|uniref:Uncharacterized protein n=1 Tax=Rhizophagus clarus TaxID=94130 RepID=A0A8H3LYD5_9GLOM|nr:hypothetical protein GLOIN_2v1678543 [Rhizophagus clarus]
MNVRQDKESDIRVVIGLDFGITYSGFAYCHVSDEDNVCPNVLWCGEAGQKSSALIRIFLINHRPCNEVKLWGAPALAKKQTRKKRKGIIEYSKPVELFKLHLEKSASYYNPCRIFETAKAIMRTCAFNVGLIKRKYSTNLQFTTEPEAAAIYCMKKNLNEQALAKPGANFMIVDCRVVQAGEFCGSTYVDTEFIKYLRKIFGNEPMDLLENNYGQRQYLIQQFCKDLLFLKYAYGCYGYDMWKKWVYGDPIDRRTPEGFIVKFKCLARHGTKMNVDQEVTIIRVPIFEDQENMITKIYYTRRISKLDKVIELLLNLTWMNNK